MRVKSNRVLNNASWIIGCKIVQSVLGLFIGIFTARYLGPANYGVINYAASLASFLAPIMYLGFNSTLVQEIVNAPDKEGKILGTAITMSSISAIICIAGGLSFAVIANRNAPATVIVCFLYSLLLLFQALELIQYWFQAKLKSKYTSITMFAVYVVVSAYKLYLLVTNKSIYWFAVSNALDYCLIAIALLVIYKKIGGQKLSFSWEIGKILFSKSKYYIISAMMITIFANTDKIMIKSMVGERQTGYYSAAVACALLTSFIFTAIIDSARPVIFEGAKISQRTFEKRLKLLYSVIIYVSLIQSIIITVFAKLIILVLYGEDYLEAVNALRIIVWYTSFSYMGAVRDIWILSKGKQNLLLFINSFGAAANIVLNALLIPVIGIDGAAIASLCTQFLTNFVLGFIIKPIRRNNFLILQSLSLKFIYVNLKSIIKKQKE